MVAVGDGALGFWAALRNVWPETREQRCWCHKMVNVLDKLPKRQQPKAKRILRDIMNAESRAEADGHIESFKVAFEKQEKAIACLVKDQEQLLAFFDFPAKQWVTKGAGNRTKALAMASSSWRWLSSDGADWMPASSCASSVPASSSATGSRWSARTPSPPPEGLRSSQHSGFPHGLPTATGPVPPPAAMDPPGRATGLRTPRGIRHAQRPGSRHHQPRIAADSRHADPQLLAIPRRPAFLGYQGSASSDTSAPVLLRSRWLSSARDVSTHGLLPLVRPVSRSRMGSNGALHLTHRYLRRAAGRGSQGMW